MRWIKFRGICIKTGKWVYGDLIHAPLLAGGKLGLIGIKEDGCYPVEVLVMSVGEYTGLKDKNGVEIYEGDIIDKKYVSFGVDKGFAKIVHGCWMVVKDNADSSYYNLYHYKDGLEVIGNIHEEKA